MFNKILTALFYCKDKSGEITPRLNIGDDWHIALYTRKYGYIMFRLPFSQDNKFEKWYETYVAVGSKKTHQTTTFYWSNVKTVLTSQRAYGSVCRYEIFGHNNTHVESEFGKWLLDYTYAVEGDITLETMLQEIVNRIGKFTIKDRQLAYIYIINTLPFVNRALFLSLPTSRPPTDELLVKFYSKTKAVEKFLAANHGNDISFDLLEKTLRNFEKLRKDILKNVPVKNIKRKLLVDILKLVIELYIAVQLLGMLVVHAVEQWRVL